MTPQHSRVCGLGNEMGFMQSSDHARCAIVTGSENGRVDHRQGSAQARHEIIPRSVARLPWLSRGKSEVAAALDIGPESSPEALRGSCGD